MKLLGYCSLGIGLVAMVPHWYDLLSGYLVN